MGGATRCRCCALMCWPGSARPGLTRWRRISASLHQCIMRTTLDIDDDLLAAAKELARREKTTAGEVVSRLLRQSLTGAQEPTAVAYRKTARRTTAGFRPFPARAGVVASDDTVNA